MHSNWRYRLAGLAAAAAAALAMGTGQLAAATAAHATVAVHADCPQGTHWDDVLHACT